MLTVLIRGRRHGPRHPLQEGVLVEPVAAVMFMSGIILTIVGSGRAVAVRVADGAVATDEVGTQPIPLRFRPDVARLLWIAVAIYGLFLAAAAVAVSG
jgi:hypothetical protein